MNRGELSGEHNNPKRLYIYNRILEYMKNKWKNLYEDKDKFIVIFRDFNVSVSTIKRTSKDLAFI